MKSKVQVTMLAGTSPHETFNEAKRLSNLLAVLVEYKFNDFHVCVKGNDLFYAVNKHGDSVEWFIRHLRGENI